MEKLLERRKKFGQGRSFIHKNISRVFGGKWNTLSHEETIDPQTQTHVSMQQWWQPFASYITSDSFETDNVHADIRMYPQ